MWRAAASILLGALASFAADVTVDQVMTAVRSDVKPQQAMEYMRRVYATDRWFTFPKFQETAEYLKQAMRDDGLENVEVLGAPADGVTHAGYWTEPLAWDVKQARLELIDPGVPEEFRVLADRKKVPASLGMWSGPTPPGGTVAEIIDAGKAGPEQIEKMDIAGKLVLTSDNPSGIKWVLAKKHALGAINAYTENPGLKDDRQWINAWGDYGWAFIKSSTPLVCFSITPHQAEFVRKLLAQGRPVRARAMVDSRYYAGVYPYVTGVIPGGARRAHGGESLPESNEEVLTLGHSSEQGAQDNATGVAAMLESLATLNRLIAASKLPRPRRTIRVLLMGEMYGSMHYVATHPDTIRNTVAAMCVDTPAAPYDLAGTEYTFYMNPHAAKSYTDAFVLHLAEQYFSKLRRPFHWNEYMTGTDTYLAEPAVGIPTVWPYSGTGVVTHHNSADTPDKVDPRSLRDLAIVNATYLYYLANAGEEQALWLAQVAANRGYDQILAAAEPFLDQVFQSGGGNQFSQLVAGAREKIAYAVDRETQAVLSVSRLVPPPRRQSLEDAVKPLVKGLADYGRAQSARLDEAATHVSRKAGVASTAQLITPSGGPPSEAARIVVKRKKFGTIPLDEMPIDRREGYPSGAWDTRVIAALYWCDGTRNLAEVIRLTDLELGHQDFDFVGYFKFLLKHGYVEFTGN